MFHKHEHCKARRLWNRAFWGRGKGDEGRIEVGKWPSKRS